MLSTYTGFNTCFGMFIDFNTTRAFFNQHVPSGLLAVVALQLTGMEFFSCIP